MSDNAKLPSWIDPEPIKEACQALRAHHQVWYREAYHHEDEMIRTIREEEDLILDTVRKQHEDEYVADGMYRSSPVFLIVPA